MRTDIPKIPRSFPVVLLLISGVLFYLGFNAHDDALRAVGIGGGFLLIVIAIICWLWYIEKLHKYARYSPWPVDVHE